MKTQRHEIIRKQEPNIYTRQAHSTSFAFFFFCYFNGGEGARVYGGGGRGVGVCMEKGRWQR